MMRRELPEAMNPPETSIVCILMLRDRLEDLLNKFPNLILKKDELPPKDSFYAELTFELGIPDSERGRTFFRSQYPPKAQEIEIFRKLLTPLIRAGVYRPSNSPHNNPVMLVHKSTRKGIEYKPKRS